MIFSTQMRRIYTDFLFIFTIIICLAIAAFVTCKLQTRELVPALQSIWFIPHVTSYVFAYSVIGCAFVLGVFDFFTTKGTKKPQRNNTPCDFLRSLQLNFLVKIGTVALTSGMCLGAIWAKKAWGQYWSWDIKETAALITWAIFTLYIHIQIFTKINKKLLLIILIIGFLSLNFTWWGVKLLPSAQKSPHTFYRSY